jgi:hypothetical protein
MEHKISAPNKAVNSAKFFGETGFTLFVRDNEWFITGDCTKAQAEAALNAHDGATPERTVAEKLASVGLSIDDLKAALA